jgi:hypothetical protein
MLNMSRYRQSSVKKSAGMFGSFSSIDFATAFKSVSAGYLNRASCFSSRSETYTGIRHDGSFPGRYSKPWITEMLVYKTMALQLGYFDDLAYRLWHGYRCRNIDTRHFEGYCA